VVKSWHPHDSRNYRSMASTTVYVTNLGAFAFPIGVIVFLLALIAVLIVVTHD
jgi:hypothetical protein